ncbi:MAG: hypothetical protein K0S09_1173 [Sphingobacteriaceae bacterium]|jgi:hypothetical protein|nr:hypothetical protein [Sphingobacteriaceae bacterium]
MNKQKLKLLAGIIMLFSMTACEKALDINDNPNYVADAAPSLLLPSGTMFSASRIGGEYQLLGGIWAQHYAQNNNSSQYRTIDSYNLTNSAFNTAWSSMWAGGLKDLKSVMEKTKVSGQWSYYVAAEVTSAFDFHILNDLYGAIPITEGLDLDNFANPKFVDSKEVNAIIINMLNDAIAKKADATASESMGNSDIIFKGDINNWIKFAKSLKLKILMRDFAANQAAIQALLTENDLLTVDAKVDIFTDVEHKSNPLYEQDQRKLNTNSNLRASNTLLKYLLAKNDPRISSFFYPTDQSTTNPALPKYVGLEQGDYTANGISNAQTSRAKLDATDPVYFMSAAEVAFLKAEAYARLNNAAQAKTNYDTGVTLAFQRWGQNAAPFIAAGGAYAFVAGTVEKMVEQIITQKWVASTRTQAWDAFFDQNRTGYPAVSPVATTSATYVPGQYTISVNTVLPAGELPRRLLFPKNSSDYNTNTPKVVPESQKMWWHK